MIVAKALLSDAKTVTHCTDRRKVDGVASLIAQPPPSNSTTMHSSWFAKTEIYVFANQPNFPVRPKRRNIYIKDAILKTFSF